MSGKQIQGAIAGIPPISEREAGLLAENPDQIKRKIEARIDAWVDKTARLVGSTEKPPKRKLVEKFRQRGRSSLLDQYRHLFPTKSNEELAAIAGCTKANVRAYRIRWFNQPVRKNKSRVKNQNLPVQVAPVQVDSGRMYAYIMPDCPGVVFSAASTQEAAEKAKSYHSANPIPIGIFHV